MTKVNILGLFLVVVMTVCSSQMSWAGGTSYYKDLSIAVKNPETAKGRVYLRPHNDYDTTYCIISNDPQIAKVEGNFTANDGKFKVNMFVFPSDGYVLDCLSSPAAYSSGNYRSEYYGYNDGYPLTTTVITIDADTTTNCTKTRPPQGSYVKPSSSQEAYAIFIPAKKMTVRNKVAGNVSSVVNAGTYGEAANDLIVTGPLNGTDLKYLNKLSQEKGLIRLDLSGASFTNVPDSAFYGSCLYELKLPKSVKKIGKYAFANSIGLKPISMPSGIEKEENTISGCWLMNLLGLKEESTQDSIDLLDLILEGPLGVLK